MSVTFHQAVSEAVSMIQEMPGVDFVVIESHRGYHPVILVPDMEGDRLVKPTIDEYLQACAEQGFKTAAVFATIR